MAIDWKFIAEIEGESKHKTSGYVPHKGKSGFTVGSFDIGQHSGEDIRRIIQSYQNKLGKTYPLAQTTDLYKKLVPYTEEGRIGSVWSEFGSREGYDMLAKTEEFKEDEIKYLVDAKRYEFERNVGSDQFKEDFPEWGKFDDRTKTVLSSVGWQFGTGEGSPFRKLYSLKGDKKAIAKELRLMSKDDYEYRRGREVEYLENDPAFSEMKRLDNPVGHRE